MHLKTESALRAEFRPAMDLSVAKQMSKLDKHARNFISKSPFLCIATANAEGKADISPRGDPPGFVQALDDRTLVIPDRPGNNRLDTMANIVANPNVALIFFIPGIEDTLRVAGRARIVKDADLLKPATVNGKAPLIGIVVEIDEIFFHCAKALKRSHFWGEENKVKKQDMPSLARIILDQTSASGRCEDDEKVTATEVDIEEQYRTELY